MIARRSAPPAQTVTPAELALLADRMVSIRRERDDSLTFKYVDASGAIATLTGPDLRSLAQQLRAALPTVRVVVDQRPSLYGSLLSAYEITPAGRRALAEG